MVTEGRCLYPPRGNAIEALVLFFANRDIIPARGVAAVRGEVTEGLAADVLMKSSHNNRAARS